MVYFSTELWLLKFNLHKQNCSLWCANELFEQYHHARVWKWFVQSIVWLVPCWLTSSTCTVFHLVLNLYNYSYWFRLAETYNVHAYMSPTHPVCCMKKSVKICAICTLVLNSDQVTQARGLSIPELNSSRFTNRSDQSASNLYSVCIDHVHITKIRKWFLLVCIK